MRWNVADYERFRDERSRPFFDLCDRIAGDDDVKSVVDLGCGTGELTRSLCDRFPAAVVLGLDSSPEMLAAARPRAIPGRLQFEAGDAGRFRPAAPVDVIVSNAALHWVPDHEALVPRLASTVAPGGTLAVQMPSNFDAPSHTLIRETATEGPWAQALAGAVREAAVRPLAFYVETLRALGFAVDAWETTYMHIFDGNDPDPVLGWVRGTALRPVLNALDADAAAEFTARFAAKLRAAYPAGPHGTLFPFKRLFFVARRTA